MIVYYFDESVTMHHGDGVAAMAKIIDIMQGRAGDYLPKCTTNAWQSLTPDP